jgi:hypothetical protein
MAGLTGKPLLYLLFRDKVNGRYFTSVFVSLGVFLFGTTKNKKSGLI